MVFRTRNCYYLRISEKMVLPLYLYLDERHLDWMSDVVLQHVLSDLRPRILPKLHTEISIQGTSKAAKALSTVDTHRGETYQFCYFIRNVEPHAVVIKSRTFTTAPARARPKAQAAAPPKLRPVRAAKRKAPPAKKAPKKKKWKGKKKASPGDMDEDDQDASSSSDIYISDDDDEMEEDNEIEDGTPQDDQPVASAFDLEIEEEEKPKPILHLKYQGFQIYGKCLCVVVEPWPLPPKESKSINDVLTDRTRLSVPPRRPGPSVQQSARRGETPLFLPDDDADTPEFPSVHSLFTMDKESDEEEDEGRDPFANMIAFSQALKNTRDERPGAVAVDDEDMDSAALFGDADEIREL